MRSLLALSIWLILACQPALGRTPSPGCDAATRRPLAAVVDPSGQRRDAIVVTPPGYRPDEPAALVIAFHGRTNDNARLRSYVGLEAAARTPTVFAYPAGRRDRAGRFTWTDADDHPDQLRDAAFFDGLLATLAGAYCVDLDRVFVTGHSLGASFANSLACLEPRRIRAVATVAGGIVPRRCAGPVAALLLHNPADRDVPIAEGVRARDAFMLDRPEPAEPPAVQLGPYACLQYRAGPAPVVWCPYHDSTNARGRFYPHQWPPGAADAIMEFFQGFP